MGSENPFPSFKTFPPSPSTRPHRAFSSLMMTVSLLLLAGLQATGAIYLPPSLRNLPFFSDYGVAESIRYHIAPNATSTSTTETIIILPETENSASDSHSESSAAPNEHSFAGVVSNSLVSSSSSGGHVKRNEDLPPGDRISPYLLAWHEDSVPVFLRQYMERNHDDPVYVDSGLAQSLVNCVIKTPSNGTTEAGCGSLQEFCKPNPRVCQNMAIQVVDELESFGVLAAVIIDNIEPGFEAGSKRINDLEYTQTFWKGKSANEKVGFAIEAVRLALRGIFASVLPWHTERQWHELLEEQMKNQETRMHQAMFANPNSEQDGTLSRNKWDAKFKTQLQLSDLDDREGQGWTKDENPTEAEMKVGIMGIRKTRSTIVDGFFMGSMAYTYKAVLKLVDNIADESVLKPELMKIVDQVDVQELYKTAASLAVKSFAGKVGGVLDGSLRLPGLEGPAVFGLLEFGSFSAVTDLQMHTLADTLTEGISTRLFTHATNAAMAGQKTFISCTNDFRQNANRLRDRSPSHACDSDNSGPAHSKGCLAGTKHEVCYLYYLNKNNHNTLPPDWPHWPTTHRLPASAIIESSVHAYDNNLVSLLEHESNWPLTDLAKPFTLTDPATPGGFNQPICFSRHNWNTPMKKRIRCAKSDPFCKSQALPCNCGLWGTETLEVWNALGLDINKDKGARTTCHQQIEEKIQDPLERYAAYCNLGVRRTGIGKSRVNGFIRKMGRDKYCDVVLGVLSQVREIKELDAEQGFLLRCKVQGVGGKRCKLYEEEWKQLEERYAGRVAEGSKRKSVAPPPMEAKMMSDYGPPEWYNI